jgi:hypothetical protein
MTDEKKNAKEDDQRAPQKSNVLRFPNRRKTPPRRKNYMQWSLLSAGILALVLVVRATFLC